jgi:hypothetical protein
MIAVFNLSPGQAHAPVVALLSTYLLFALPAAVVPFRLIRRWEPPTAAQPPCWQFSVKTLLLVTTAICIFIALCRFLIAVSVDDEIVFFGGFTLCVIALCSVLIWLFVAGAGLVPAATQPPDEFV